MTIHLASNKINKIQGLNFKSGVSEIWGLQYHPEITYKKMVDIIKFRKDALIEKRNDLKMKKLIIISTSLKKRSKFLKKILEC